MSRVAIITDSHFGARSDAQNFYEYFKQSNEKMFQTIDGLGITTLLHLGDVFDRRKYINYLTAKRAREDFFEPLHKRGITCHFLVGNHDVSYKNTNEVNSLIEMLRGYENFIVYTEPTEIELYDNKILLLPWICDANKKASVDLIKNTTATICLGHLSVNGYEQNRGHIREGANVEDFNKSDFNRFSIVASGHFHHKSSVDNIHYLGAAYEFTWADHNDPRGYHIFDFSDLSFTFYQNPFKKFHMIVYDDIGQPEKVQEHIKTTDFSYLENCYVKVVVVGRNNPYLFDLFIDKLYKASPVDISMVEDAVLFDDTGEGDLDQVEDTVTLISNYIDGLQLSLDSTKMKSMMKSIYQEAMILEEV